MNNQADQSIKEMADQLGHKRENLLPLLQAIIRKKNYLTEEDIIEVAREMKLSAADVFGTASFYSFLDLETRGKYIIRVCKTITCQMHGSHEILNTIKNRLRIDVGETTNDKLFTLLTTNCLGWCHKGPVMLINEKVYPELDPEKTLDIIEQYLKPEQN